MDASQEGDGGSFEGSLIGPDILLPDATWEGNLSTCSLCQAKLGKRHMNPRHHCRRCGKCVCSSCSPNTVQIDGIPKPQRVCKNCFAGGSRGSEDFRDGPLEGLGERLAALSGRGPQQAQTPSSTSDEEPTRAVSPPAVEAQRSSWASQFRSKSPRAVPAPAVDRSKSPRATPRTSVDGSKSPRAALGASVARSKSPRAAPLVASAIDEAQEAADAKAARRAEKLAEREAVQRQKLEDAQVGDAEISFAQRQAERLRQRELESEKPARTDDKPLYDPVAGGSASAGNASELLIESALDAEPHTPVMERAESPRNEGSVGASCATRVQECRKACAVQ